MAKRACYYQGCGQDATTKEHVPPKAFFPSDQRDQLLTVPSCPEHNNDKSADDLYVLAHICLHASPNNGARDVFIKRVLPQLDFNEEAFRRILVADAVRLPEGMVKYRVNVHRFNRFFDALSFGIVCKSANSPLPSHYSSNHLYHNLEDENATPQLKAVHENIDRFYSGLPSTVLDFGAVRTRNATVYSVSIYGLSDYRSSITLVHKFFGIFRVTSMLTLNFLR